MLSILKILFTVAVIAVVINAFKYRARISEVRRTMAEAQARERRKAAGTDVPAAQDLVPCPKCGAYVAVGQPCSCGKT